MQTEYYILICAVLITSILVLGGMLQSRTNWRWCPRCEKYHSPLGKTATYPHVGTCVGDEVCGECKSSRQASSSSNQSPKSIL